MNLHWSTAARSSTDSAVLKFPLIAGDVFLIPPGEEHGYLADPNSAITNCYFFPERLGRFSEYVKDGTFQSSEIPCGLEDVKNQWDNLLSTISPERWYEGTGATADHE